jgi:hypothetical protein
VFEAGNFLGELFVALILLLEAPPFCSIHNRSIPVMRGA